MFKLLESEANDGKVSESASQPNAVVVELTTPNLRKRRDTKLADKQNSSQKTSGAKSQPTKKPKKKKVADESDAYSPKGKNGGGRGGGAGGRGRGGGAGGSGSGAGGRGGRGGSALPI